jgi:predicted amidohydrolase
MKFTIAVAQTDSAVGNLEKNIQHHLDFTKRAIKKKADLVVFPELSLTGYSVRDLNWELAVNLNAPQRFKELLALSKSITIIAGGIEESESFGMYNAAFVFEDGKMYSGHRKIYPPTYGMFEEMRYFNQGQTVRSFPSKLGSLGILICEDLWHLSLPYMLAHEGAKIIIAIAASPTRLGGSSEKLPNAVVNSEHHKTYARLLSSFLVFSNRVGVEDGVNFWGGSEIVDPTGEIISAAKLFDEDLIVAEINDKKVQRARRFSRHFVDDSMTFTIRQLQQIEREKRNKGK